MTLAEYLARHKCIGTPQLRLLSEDDKARVFLCLTCYELWSITRSRLKAQVREENRLERIRQITEAERQRAGRRICGPYYIGAPHAA